MDPARAAGPSDCGILTCTPRMTRLLENAKRMASLETAILIEGETGTGKNVLARAIHAWSPRRAGPFVTLDCGSLPESLAESELFGHERGSFTGADRPYGGRIEAAAGGTLLLDEVNSLSLPMQAKLLRFLEAGEFVRVGRQQPVTVDARLVSASNVPLEQLVASGRMREDFFYRINVIRLEIPPLRERLDDLPLLVEHLLEQEHLARALGVRRVDDEVLAQLKRLSLRGNVRELRNLLGRGLVAGATDGVLRRLESPGDCETSGHRPPSTGLSLNKFRAWIAEREAEYFLTLAERHATIAEQAAASGLPERTLYRKLKHFRCGPVPGRQGT